MKRTLIILLLFFSAGICIYLVWNKRAWFNSQPTLNNKNYPLVLDSIKTIKSKLREQNPSPATLEKHFVKIMNQKIFPYWYGTKWNFHGTTETPNEGSIACGYFVTTTLRDAGVPLNRVKLAQCASEEMIKKLVSKKNIHHLSSISINQFEKKMKEYGNGLYIIGLDTHTGFVLVSSKGNYFIHSSGIFPFKVIREELKDATLIARSKYRVVGKISHDETFLKKWIEKE